MEKDNENELIKDELELERIERDIDEIERIEKDTEQKSQEAMHKIQKQIDLLIQEQSIQLIKSDQHGWRSAIVLRRVIQFPDDLNDNIEIQFYKTIKELWYGANTSLIQSESNFTGKLSTPYDTVQPTDK